MKIDHVAIWVKDLEIMKAFYVKYFNMTAGEKYSNPKKHFSSYFLSFDLESARIEIMHNSQMSELDKGSSIFGWAHIAISVGSHDAVDDLTEQLRIDGYAIHGEPRTTGDGYYESVILDPEGNQVEITL